MIGQKLKYRRVLMLFAVLIAAVVLTPYAIAEEGHAEEEEVEHGQVEADDHGHMEGDGHEVAEADDHGHMEDDEHKQAGEEDHAAHAHSKESFKEYGLVKSEPGYKEFNIMLSRFKFSPPDYKGG